MSGFLGIVSEKINLHVAEKALEELTHINPNQNSYFINESKNIFLGTNQFVFSDNAYEKQPFLYKEFMLVYDGKLYNVEELQKELIFKGYEFNKNSNTLDTEVLIKMFAEYKENCLEKLNGVFSFIIWDKRRKEIFGCRDRLGTKPFYYYFTNKSKNNKTEFMASTRIKPILKYHDINSITLNGLREILGLGPSHTPGCGIFSDIYELKPAHYLKLKLNLQTINNTDKKHNNTELNNTEVLNIKRYWMLPIETHADDFKTTVFKTKTLLKNSIQQQIVSDTPMCSFLSGGLDSTIITLTARNMLPNLETFSIDYQENEKHFTKNDFQVSQDNDFIELLINKFQIKHNYLTITNEQLVQMLFDALILKDYPSMVDIDSSLLWFCQQVKGQYGIAFSGEGSDEIFGGYPWFYKEKIADFFPWIRNLEERNLLLNQKFRKKLNLIDYVQEKYKQSLNETPLTENENDFDKYHKQLTYLNLTWFTQTLFDRLERMSTGVGLEVRMPFADHKLVEYLFNVPWKFKYYKKQEKGLLREAFKEIVPFEILNRKKNPYPKTHNPKYLKSMKKLLKQRLKNKNSILNYIFEKQAIKNLFKDSIKQKPWFGQLMTRPQLLAYLYQFDLWFENYNLNIIE